MRVIFSRTGNRLPMTKVERLIKLYRTCCEPLFIIKSQIYSENEYSDINFDINLDDVSIMSYHGMLTSVSVCATAPGTPFRDTLGKNPLFLAYANKAREHAAAVSETLHRVAAAVSSCSEPVLLKGAAFAAEAADCQVPWRSMADIDILLPEKHARVAWQRLQDLGFVSDGSPYSARLNPHLPLLAMPGSPVGVEVHTRCRQIQKDGLLEPTAVRANARRGSVRGQPVLIPSNPDRLIHLVVHGQIESHRYERRNVHLRDSLDFLLLASRPDVDLDAIAARFAEAGYRRHFVAFVRLMERLWDRRFMTNERPVPSDLDWVEEVLRGLEDPVFLARFLKKDRIRIVGRYLFEPDYWPVMAAFVLSPAHWRKWKDRSTRQDGALRRDDGS